MNTKPIILIADDEPSMLFLLNLKFKEAGFEVLTADNGEDSIKIAKEKKPDIILMDVKMPIMDGVQAFEKLKEDELTKGIKVIFLTAFGDPKSDIDVKIADEIGAADFIKKGMSLDEIVQKVKDHLPAA